MIYKKYKESIHLVPNHYISDEQIEEWPQVILPFDDITVEDLKEFHDNIKTDMLNLYDGKNENKINKQVVLQRLQRTLIVFLNSKWS